MSQPDQRFQLEISKILAAIVSPSGRNEAQRAAILEALCCITAASFMGASKDSREPHLRDYLALAKRIEETCLAFIRERTEPIKP